jgi:hypothetical protein
MMVIHPPIAHFPSTEMIRPTVLPSAAASPQRILGTLAPSHFIASVMSFIAPQTPPCKARLNPFTGSNNDPFIFFFQSGKHDHGRRQSQYCRHSTQIVRATREK